MRVSNLRRPFAVSKSSPLRRLSPPRFRPHGQRGADGDGADTSLAVRDTALKSARTRDLVPATSHELVFREQLREQKTNADYSALRAHSLNQATNLHQNTKLISAIAEILCVFLATLTSLRPDTYKLFLPNEYDLPSEGLQYILGKKQRLQGILGEKVQRGPISMTDSLGITAFDQFYFEPDQRLRGYIPD
jgi:hypothetical protein